MVLGLANAAWLVGIGLLLIGICHLPVPMWIRGVLLVRRGRHAGHSSARDCLPFPWSEAIWPILGSMFMFRLIVYFYDLRHDKAQPGFVRTVAYFFMLPNACFPLVSGRRFQDIPAQLLRRRRVHALSARHRLDRPRRHAPAAVSDHLLPPDARARRGDDARRCLSQYLVTNFLLYLRVSGLFHLVVGMLHLFGFRLPETHNRYLLASSFTDFWRRINIYWKDFMQKVFYYPAVFRLKKLGTEKAIVVGDAVGVPADVVPARLSVVLAARHDAVRPAGHPVLDDPRRAGRRQLAV